MNALRSRTVATIAALALMLGLGLSTIPAAAQDAPSNPPSEPCENTWVYLENGAWGYTNDQCQLLLNRWIKDDGLWYYLNENGEMIADGFSVIDGTLYYFHSSGVMATGWFTISIYDSWGVYDSFDVYAEPSGAVLMDTSRTYGGVTYYMGNLETDFMYPFVYDTDPAQIPRESPNVYFVKNHSTIATGWFQYDNEWYYADSAGKLAYDGWRYINGAWYYFHADGTMAYSEIIFGEKFSWVTSSGAMATGWVKVSILDLVNSKFSPSYDNLWIYADASGYLVRNDWKLINGKWYYFSDFWMVHNGLALMGDDVYHFGSDGAMSTGWVYATHEVDSGGAGKDGTPPPEYEGWYYADSSGALVRNAWRYLGGKWYYFGPHAQMYRNTLQYFESETGGSFFRFDSSGAASPFNWHQRIALG
ncbi:MAG: hypothetical protein GX483_08235 [Actinomycetaceae bacterium]|nr:hypothetical protein [Actinomycetaceae bacterium]